MLGENKEEIRIIKALEWLSFLVAEFESCKVWELQSCSVYLVAAFGS